MEMAFTLTLDSNQNSTGLLHFGNGQRILSMMRLFIDRRNVFSLLSLLLTLTIVAVANASTAYGQAFGQAPRRTTNITVTFRDTQQRPIKCASFGVRDAARHILEDPLATVYLSGDDGKVEYNIPSRDMYTIQGYAGGYLPKEVQVASKTGHLSVVMILKRAPLPAYPITTVRATILNTRRQSIPQAGLLIFNTKGKDLGNLMGSPDLLADNQGQIEKTVRAGGTCIVQASAGNYRPAEIKVKSKPGIITLVFVLKPYARKQKMRG